MKLQQAGSPSGGIHRHLLLFIDCRGVKHAFLGNWFTSCQNVVTSKVMKLEQMGPQIQKKNISLIADIRSANQTQV